MSRGRRTAARLAAAMVRASAAGALLRRRRHQRGDFRVFILEYHDVTNSTREPEGVVSATRFRRHLRHLRRHCRLVSLSRATALLNDPGALGEDVAAITLDDGYAGNYDSAFPVLREEQVPAAIFVTTGFLDGTELWFDLAARCFEAARGDGRGLAPNLQGDLRMALGQWPFRGSTERAVEQLKLVAPAARDRLLSELRAACAPLTPAARPLRWEQVRKMIAAGIEIGAHTVSHPILSTLSADEQVREIIGARDRITERTHVLPTLFAYPNGGDGDFDAQTVSILQHAGFTAACTTSRGSNRPGCDLYRLRRIGVGAEPCFVLAARLAGVFDDGVRQRLPRLASIGKRRVRTEAAVQKAQPSLPAPSPMPGRGGRNEFRPRVR